MNESNHFTIDCDVQCFTCQYNLRGLTVDTRCPECGEPVEQTLRWFSINAIPAEMADALAELRRRRMQSVADSVRSTTDGVLFVSDAFSFACRHAGLFKRHVGALQVCLAVRDWSMSYFNDAAEAKELLAEWGIRSSEDVGRIIYALIEAGLARRSDDDSPDQFDGLFTLDNLFDPDWRDRGRAR